MHPIDDARAFVTFAQWNTDAGGGGGADGRADGARAEECVRSWAHTHTVYERTPGIAEPPGDTGGQQRERKVFIHRMRAGGGRLSLGQAVRG
jgi:hypothetical protein